MKVTTVACIQGAWLPNITPQNILDIGAGTGLLSLMAAQKYDCLIDAVEIEDRAFDQLKENINRSPWLNRIRCFHSDIKKFADEGTGKYDLIISNPPFYQKQLLSPKDQRNLARHEMSLTAEELLDASLKLIHENGLLSVLLPPEETKLFEKAYKQKGFSLIEQLEITDNEQKAASSMISVLSLKPVQPSVNKLTIKNPDGAYSNDFISLLKDYYLYL
jgi:tRNA1Val (adenine37-N6)-methyltransferase